MNNNRQPIFKMIHLRGVDTNTIEAPINPDNGEQGAIIEKINKDKIDPFNIDEATERSLKAALGEVKVPNLLDITGKIEKLLAKHDINSLVLGRETIDFNGQSLMLKEVASNHIFQKEFLQLYNSWVLDRLTNTNRKKIHEKENLLRIANLLKHLGNDSRIDPKLIDIQLLSKAQIVLPKSITRKQNKINDGTNENKIESSKDKYFKEIEQYKKINADLDALDQVQKQLLYNWASEESENPKNQNPTSVSGTQQKGIFNKASNWLFGTKSKLIDIDPIIEPAKDRNFFNNIKNSVSDTASPFVDKLAARETTTLSKALEILKLSYTELNKKGEKLYGSINTFKDESGTYIPPSKEEPVPKKLEYAIKALGWGDLIVSTERLVDYRAQEIAHIENVLPGEIKVRNHVKSKRIEESIETETIEENESEHDLETTDRYELQTESTKAIETDFSISAGINTSGRYGLTKVETSLDSDFGRTQSESRSSTTNVAKEIVEKAVERTLKKTRELRQRNVITEIIEKNKHTLSNVSNSPDTAPNPISGIYRWVEKIHEVQLRHYGKRFMLEFHIPEPAITLTSAKPIVNVDMKPPHDFDLKIKNVNVHSYKVQAERYQATGIEPPPEKFIEIGYAWASTPDEEANKNEAEDTIATKVNIPDGYKIIGFEMIVDALPNGLSTLTVQASVGGKSLVLKPLGENSIKHSLLFIAPQVWPDGIPITAVAHGHFDKTLSINVHLLCILTDLAYEKWQVETYNQISSAYQARLIDYQEALAQSQFRDNLEIDISSSPETINRRTEREELKKWSIKTIRNDVINFNGIIPVDVNSPNEVSEIDPNAADNNVRPIQFYEEAFEWEQMSYFFYPYFWGKREHNRTRRSFTDTDSRFESFLRSGAARVIVPVTPGYEKRVLMYLSADHTLSEIDKINLSIGLKDGETPEKIETSEYNTLWAELLQDRMDDVARGSGTLNVKQTEKEVSINDDSTWELNDLDIGREIFIRGNRYEIESIDTTDNSFTLNVPYIGDPEENAIYVTGSVPFGPSWTVNLPTNLVILDENKDNLSIN